MANKCPTCHSDNPETSRFCAGCGTQLPPPQGHSPVMTETLRAPVQELTTGSTFAGRYQVIEELGRGGMGRVYKVFDTAIKEKIALKLIRPEIASLKDTIERFSNEIRLARRIGHRNVCRMFDIGVTCPPHRDPALVIGFYWIEGGGNGQETVHAGAGHHDAPGGGSPSQSI